MIACSKPQEIKGQVFIVTKGGFNFKLGSVGVMAFTEEDFKSHIERRKQLFLTEKKQLQKDVDLAKAEFDQSVVEFEEASGKVNKLKPAGPGYPYLLSNEEEEKKKNKEEKERLYLEKQSQVDAKRPEPIYFADLPKPLSSSTTDADGNFQLSLPSGKYVIVATSQREAAGETEAYYWAVKLEVPRQATGPVILSNSNLTSARSPEGFGMPQ